MLLQPTHTEDDIVALQRRGGELRSEGDGSALRGHESVVDGGNSSGGDHGPVSELHRVLRRRQWESTSLGEYGIDEAESFRTTIDESGEAVRANVSNELEHSAASTSANSGEMQHP
jgi:hypothetical protein